MRWPSMVCSLVACGAFAFIDACGISNEAAPGDDAHPADAEASDDGWVRGPDGPAADGAPGPTLEDGGKDAHAALDGGMDADAHADAGDPPPPPPGPLAPGYVDYEVNHILETGQSNSVASGARPQNTFTAGTAFTSAQPYTNLMFDTGVMTAGPKPGVAEGVNCNGSGCPATSYRAPTMFVPLIENDSFFGGGDRVETASSSMANEISSLAISRLMFGVKAGYPAKHDLLVSLHGRSGNTYWCLRKGGCNYKPASEIPAFEEAVKQVEAGKALAAAAGKSYIVRAVTTDHGESDHYGYQDGGSEFPLPGTNGVANRVKDYDDALIEWQEDYEAMVQGITGQVQPVPLFVSGLSGWTGTQPAHRTSKLAALQLTAHERAPGKVILVAPGYIFDPAIQSNGQLECLHYSLLGQQHLGEYFAKAYVRTVLEGKPFEPVRPLAVQRVANVITVKFHVPVPPLVIDTVRVNAAGISSYGFDFLDNGALAMITSVVITAADTVTITLAATPSAGDKRLRYALNQPIPGCIGPGVLTSGGARGNLRDSDPTPSLKGFTLFNWSVAFDVAVP